MADSVLKKFDNHGETLAMKGLTINSMPGKSKEEAHELVKLGLRNDMRSHVCWHVYGLLHRADRNYPEAIKAYKQALRIDPANLQILRDLSLLQVQMRDVSGFVVTRHTILRIKPNQKINWLAFALSRHLNGELTDALSVIDSYLESLQEGAEEHEKGYESSELALYRNFILGEMPDNEENTLKHLEECKSVVVDVGAWFYRKGSLLLTTGDFDGASEAFKELFHRSSSENYRVHAGYMCAVLKLEKDLCEKALKLRGTDTVASMMQLTSDQKAVLANCYGNELKEIMPKSYACRRIPLSFLQGESLKNALDAYCKKDIVKGVPYLGADLASLFMIESGVNGSKNYSRARDPVDIKSNTTYQLIRDIVDGYIASLTSTSKFPGDNDEAPSSSILWAMYLKVQLLEFSGELEEALTLIEKCIKSNPDCVDIYERKARLLKLSGDIQTAAECLDKARELDLQDRYINNKTTKYMLRADRDETALERISLFTRHEGNPSQNLYDMQCVWYELEAAASFARQRKWGQSLKKYAAVEKHFEDYNEDQFDFHSYCIRKVTLRSYMSVLRFEDEIFGEKSYRKAAEGLIGIYLHLFDHPEDAKVNSKEQDYSKMTAAEKKKAKAIARKKKKQAEKKAEEAAANAKKGGKAEVKDDDPDGEKLLARDALEEAKKYVATLVKNAPMHFSTWIFQYDVATRRQKYLMALQALFKAKAIDPGNYQLFSRIVDFSFRILPKVTNESPAGKVILSEAASLLRELSLREFLSEARANVQNNPLTDLPTRVAVAEALITANIEPVESASQLILDGGMNGRQVTIDSCRDTLTFFVKLGEDALPVKKLWLAQVKERFPLAIQLE